jgi:serine/threonine protein kinase
MSTALAAGIAVARVAFTMSQTCPHCGAGCEDDTERCAQCGGEVLVARRFVLGERLGVGGQGCVYKGLDRETGRAVAVKVVSLQTAADWKTISLFERGTRLLQTLDHPGIPRIFAFEHDAGGRYYQVREYFAGESLQTRHERSPSLDRKRVHRLLRDLLSILAYIHGRAPALLHRDIKPSNVMFRDTAAEQPVLVDFDSATSALAQGTGTTIVVSPGYTAPEQLIGAAVPASDLYSLGMTMLFVLSGATPDNLPRVAGAISAEALCATLEPATRRVLLRLIQPDLQRRYRSAREALRDLQGLFPTTAAPLSTTTSALAKRAARSALRIGLAVLLGALLQYGIWLFYYRFHQRVIIEGEAPRELPPPNIQ